MGRARFPGGGGRRGAAGTYIPGADAFLIPGSVTWYPGNVPCLLGGDCPAAHLPNPLVPLDDDLEMWCSLETGLPLQGVWHVVHPAVFSVGCLGKETREECRGWLGAVGAWEKWGWEGGNASKAYCLPRRGQGANRVDGSHSQPVLCLAAAGLGLGVSSGQTPWMLRAPCFLQIRTWRAGSGEGRTEFM